MSGSPMVKVCKDCGERKSTDHFYRQRTRGDAGFLPRCKPCHSVRTNAWRAANPDRAKAIDEASKARNSERVSRYSAKYYAAHRKESAAAWARYYEANRARLCEQARLWATANPARRSAKLASYKRANRDRFRLYENKRRALKAGAVGNGVSAAQWREVLAGSLGICAYCNERRPLTLDHIEPLSKGGAHDVDNTAAVCKPCNSSKGDTPLVIWLALQALARSA